MTLQEKFDRIIIHIEELVGAGESDNIVISQSVATENGLESRLLADAFRFMTDMPLISYIKQRRLVRALEMKLECNLSNEETCEIVGLSEAASFSRACKNTFGCSPSQITKEILLKYTPLSFERLVTIKDEDQVETKILKTNTDNNTVCGVSAQQFAEIKQILELGAIYGLSDEEAEFVYRLATDRKLTLAKAAAFYDDFKMQIKNGSNVPGLNLLEMAEVACKRDLSFSQAQSIMFELERHGYHSISQLPDQFLDVLLSEENAHFGWDVPYIIEIAETLQEYGFSASDLSAIVDYASTYDVSVIEVIEDYDRYESDWDNAMDKLMDYNDSAEDPCGFGYRSIWELDEGQESLLDVVDENEDDSSSMDDTLGNKDNDSDVAFIARKYRISVRDALELKRDLESHGYYSIEDLPHGFFQVYFHYDIDQFVGWDIPYVCEIVEAMDQNHIPMDQLDEVMYLASKHNTDPVEIIEQFDYYLDSDDEE